MGLFNRGNGKLKGFFNKVKNGISNFKENRPILTALGGAAMGFIPGVPIIKKAGAAAKGLAGKLFKGKLSGMIQKIKESGKIDLDKVTANVRAANPSASASELGKMSAQAAAELSAETGIGIGGDYVSPDADEATRSLANAFGGLTDGDGNPFKASPMTKFRNWFKDNKKWALPVFIFSGVILGYVILGAIFGKKKRGKFQLWGRFRK